MKYNWKESANFKADVNKIKIELDNIGNDFSPHEIVEKAKNSKTELYKCFEWDNKKCGDKFRLDQARQLVRSIVIIPEKETIEIRAYESIIYNEKKCYVPTEIIVKDEELYLQLVSGIIKSIKELERKLKSYEYLNDNVKKMSEKIMIIREEFEQMNFFENECEGMCGL